MVYSDSMDFSDKFSYKILFISSYGLKDINFARFECLQEFYLKTEKREIFSHRRNSARVADLRGRCDDTAC
jgi:hypothetical protein